MAKTIRVKLKKVVDSTYGILISRGLSKGLAKRISGDGFGKKYCIITDSNTRRVFGDALLEQFRKSRVQAGLIAFPAGERSKGISTCGAILEKMLGLGFERQDCVVALGGGVAGDVAGFCASVYMRGINFVQVPTTLLAMVDSSVGGKTGVDLGMAKNSVGTFAQPKKVYVCPELLSTLPGKEVSNGLAEVIKYGVILDSTFFAFLEKNIEKALAKDPEVIERIVRRSCELKAGVVEKDELESNYRRILNFGHTIGHALEALGNYSELGHGEAISIGMACEAEISFEMGLLPIAGRDRVLALLHRARLPLRISGYSPDEIIRAAKSDKKVVSGKVIYSLPVRIGKMHSRKGNYGVGVADSLARDVLERFA